MGRLGEGRIRPPLITGHEFSGVVEAVGPGVKRPQVGDHVSLESHIVCHACPACRTGNYHVCLNTQILGVDRDGGFAEYALVPAENAWVNPKDLPFEVAAILEPFGNAVHTVYAGSGVSGKSVLITGAGPIGLMAAMVARASGAGPILVSDPNPYRLAFARPYADRLVNPLEEDLLEVVRRVTGSGVEVLLEFSGNEAAIHQGLMASSPGGRRGFWGSLPTPSALTSPVSSSCGGSPPSASPGGGSGRPGCRAPPWSTRGGWTLRPSSPTASP